MAKQSRYKLLVTIKNQIGLFRPKENKNSSSSRDYVLAQSFDNPAKDLKTSLIYVFFAAKSNNIDIRTNDVIYTKVGFLSKAYRFCGDEIKECSKFLDDLIEIPEFISEEISVFQNRLKRDGLIYDIFNGQIIDLKDLFNAEVYTIKESDETPNFYTLALVKGKKIIENHKLFKEPTTLQNVIYNFCKEKEVDKTATLVKYEEIVKLIEK